MKDLESVYDKEIAPLMEKIIETCKKHGMPLFATFQYGDESFCTTQRHPTGKGDHSVFGHYNAIKQCILSNGVNIDKYMFWVMKKAADLGHSSMILSQLGVRADAGRVPPANNPHHSGWLADDERRATECPHCGNESYDREFRCLECGLFDLDDEKAKRFRLAELLEAADADQIDKVFSFLVTEVMQ